MIDTHCHLTFPDFADRLDETIAEARAVGVAGLITISTTTANAPECLAIAHRFDNVWCSAGVHPLYADKGPHNLQSLASVARDPRCVAWGELGLDNHYDHPPRNIQHNILVDQLALIESRADIDLPIILHCREAFDDLIPILRDTRLKPERFVFHCFTGTPADARKCLDFGAMLSFTGVVTYPNAQGVQDAAVLAPADRILVETDAPFLSPAPHRGKRPCQPAWVRCTAEHIARIRNVPFDDLHAQLNNNTEQFFRIRHP